MPRRRAPLLIALATAAALAVSLTGCVGGGGDAPSPKPTASKSALFSSDEEALKAAEKAYQAYLDVANELGQGGWKDTSKLADVAAGQVLESELDGALEFAAKGYVQSGASTMDSMRIQSSGSEVAAYVCRDVSTTDVIGPDGVSIVRADRLTRLPLQVVFEETRDGLRLTESKTWSGKDFC
ncbi:hypothetical protein FJ656_03155 [Schumannella luteola]|uniref:Lipoprotein n=1 Tax=Schumannella luteola TaxID=472059 RepID=A0A852YE49_9MICO|nr:hypothetical protein [Schumannella luteola]NYG99421.1 hypothetical protein [Schumannella luteola]TPX06140.1 hypothetical protein FJ656_03155 [Schumannella luteola]